MKLPLETLSENMKLPKHQWYVKECNYCLWKKVEYGYFTTESYYTLTKIVRCLKPATHILFSLNGSVGLENDICYH